MKGNQVTVVNLHIIIVLHALLLTNMVEEIARKC